MLSSPYSVNELETRHCLLDVSRGTLLPEVAVYVQGDGRELADDAISGEGDSIVISWQSCDDTSGKRGLP